MLQLQIPILDVWRRDRILKRRQILGALRERRRRQRRDAAERQSEVSERDEICRRERIAVRNTGNAAHNSVERERAAASLIAHAISGAKHGFVFAPPRQRPAHTNGRSKVIPVVVVKLLAGIRRVPADEFHQ